MELEIKKLPGFKVVGLLYTGKNENQEISALWGQFKERGEELCPRGTKVCYGICRVPGQESLAKGKLSFSGPEEQNAGDIPLLILNTWRAFNIKRVNHCPKVRSSEKFPNALWRSSSMLALPTRSPNLQQHLWLLAASLSLPAVGTRFRRGSVHR